MGDAHSLVVGEVEWEALRDLLGAPCLRPPANWLHELFAPTAAAIDGLEAALAGLGLLDDALALDLRRPQDYFQRVWNIGFRASKLASASADTNAAPEDPSGTDADQMEETA